MSAFIDHLMTMNRKELLPNEVLGAAMTVPLVESV
jgi:hypothetical protein